MKKYTYSQTRQKLSEVLDTARKEDVIITRRGGETFRLTCQSTPNSPFDVPGVRTRATTKDILEAIKESRGRKS